MSTAAEQAAAAERTREAAIAREKMHEAEVAREHQQQEQARERQAAEHAAHPALAANRGLDPHEKGAMFGGFPLTAPFAPTGSPLLQPTTHAAKPAPPELLHTLGKVPYASNAAQLAHASDAQVEQLSKQVRLNGKDVPVEQRMKALETIEKTSETMKPADREAFVAKFAKSMGNNGIGGDDGDFGKLLKNSIKDGSGATFAASLLQELNKEHKGKGSEDVAKYTNEAVSDLRKDFADKTKTLDKIDAKGFRDVQGFGLDKSHYAKAIASFQKNEHYQEHEKDKEEAGDKLSSTLKGLALIARDPQGCQVGGSEQQDKLGETAQDTLHKDLPRIAETHAGAKAITDALSESGKGGDSPLIDVLSKVNTDATTASQLRGALVKSLGAKILAEAGKAGFSQAERDLFKGFQKLGPMFGASKEQMTELTKTMSAFRGGLSNAKVEAISSKLKKDITAIAGGHPAAAEALKALGVFAGAAAIPSDWSKFGSENIAEKFSTISNTLGTGQQAGELILDGVGALAKDGSALAGSAAGASELVSKFAGPLAIVGGAAAGGLGVSDLLHGETQKGAGELIQSAGTFIMAIGPALAETGPGAIAAEAVGALVTVIGSLVSLFAPTPDPFKGDKKDIHDALKAANVNERTAKALATVNDKGQNLGPWIKQVAQGIGCTPTELLLSMNSWDDKKLTSFIDAGRLQHDTDDNNDNRVNNARHVIGGYADDLEDPSRPFGGRGTNPAAYKKAREAYDAAKATQADDRATTVKKTQELDYNDAIVAQAAQWAWKNDLVTVSIPKAQGGSGIDLSKEGQDPAPISGSRT